jgi:hypothetical protein
VNKAASKIDAVALIPWDLGDLGPVRASWAVGVMGSGLELTVPYGHMMTQI